VHGIHDIANQGNIPHSTGDQSIYRQLANLDRDEARLLKQYDMWTARARRTGGQMAEINARRQALLVTLEPVIRAAEQKVGLR